MADARVPILYTASNPDPYEWTSLPGGPGGRGVSGVGRGQDGYFVLFYPPGPAWRAGKPVREQPLTDHVRYLDRQRTRRVLVTGGLLKDSRGGLAVVEAHGLGEAQTLALGDPAVRQGVLLVEDVFPWHPIRDARIRVKPW